MGVGAGGGAGFSERRHEGVYIGVAGWGGYLQGNLQGLREGIGLNVCTPEIRMVQASLLAVVVLDPMDPSEVGVSLSHTTHAQPTSHIIVVPVSRMPGSLSSIIIIGHHLDIEGYGERQTERGKQRAIDFRRLTCLQRCLRSTIHHLLPRPPPVPFTLPPFLT